MISRYVLDTGALIAAERGKERAARFFRLAHIGRARLVVPLPVVAEWWRGRTDVRDAILGATSVVASVEAAKTAGLALARMRNFDGKVTIDAIVIATAALLDAVVITGDVADFDRLAAHFPGARPPAKRPNRLARKMRPPAKRPNRLAREMLPPAKRPSRLARKMRPPAKPTNRLA